MTDKVREAFEAKFSLAPWGFEMDRYGEDESWPGMYRLYHVQCAYEGFKAGWEAMRKEAMDACEQYGHSPSIIAKRAIKELP